MFDGADWSLEAGGWVGENGETSKITPSRWYPMARDKSLQEHDGSSNPSPAGPSASRARRYSFFPFSASPAAPQRLQTAPVKAKRAPHVRWVFAASSITATLIWAALIGLYFRAEVAAYVTRYAGQQDIVRISTISRQLVEQKTQLPSQDSRKTDLLALQQQAAADQAKARREIELQAALLRKAGDEALQLKQAAESAMAELRQRGQAVEQKPAAVEERPGVSLPAWANSDAFVKPGQIAKQPEVAPENSKPIVEPVPLPRERAMSRNDGDRCQRYLSDDPACGTY